MNKFIVLFSSFLVFAVISCASNPSNSPNSLNSPKNNGSEPVIYFHENPAARDEKESISFLDSKTIIYSFIRGETLVSTEKWEYLINRDNIFIDSMKYQATGTYSKGTYSNEKVVINGKEFTRHINP